MSLRRGPWVDIDLVDLPDRLVMAHPGWTNDRESLSLAVREVGWFPTVMLAFLAAEQAEIKWGWIGVNAEMETVLCDAEGTPVGTGENVNDVAQVTLALINNPA